MYIITKLAGVFSLVNHVITMSTRSFHDMVSLKFWEKVHAVSSYLKFDPGHIMQPECLPAFSLAVCAINTLKADKWNEFFDRRHSKTHRAYFNVLNVLFLNVRSIGSSTYPNGPNTFVVVV